MTPEHEDKKDTGAQDALNERERQLAAREEQLAMAQRALTAREALHRLRLPAAYLEHLELGSDQALNKGLALLERLSRERAAQGEAPPAHKPLPQDWAGMGYAQRAALYRQDINQYHQAFQGGER